MNPIILVSCKLMEVLNTKHFHFHFPMYNSFQNSLFILFCFFDQKNISRKYSGYIMNWIHLLVLCFIKDWYSYSSPPYSANMYKQAWKTDYHLFLLTFILFSYILFGDGCAKSQWKRNDHIYRALLIMSKNLYFSSILAI